MKDENPVSDTKQPVQVSGASFDRIASDEELRGLAEDLVKHSPAFRKALPGIRRVRSSLNRKSKRRGSWGKPGYPAFFCAQMP